MRPARRRRSGRHEARTILEAALNTAAEDLTDLATFAAPFSLSYHALSDRELPAHSFS
jgi:plasmid stability protein